MERLTHERVNGIKTGYWSAATKEVLVQKLAAYENTGYEPDEIRAAIEQAAKSSETKTATVMAECIAGENSVSTNDNGVTQTVEARQGVALNALIEIKPRVMLRPFRTFLEVEQPESEFLLRVDPDEGIGFFEADGGIWKLEAKKNIADYFLKNMGDLIDAGKVVVMQ